MSEHPENNPAPAEPAGEATQQPAPDARGTSASVAAADLASSVDSGSHAVSQDDIDALLGSIEQTAGDVAAGAVPLAPANSGADAGALSEAAFLAQTAAAGGLVDGQPGVDSVTALPGLQSLDLPEFATSDSAEIDARKVSLLHDVNLKVKIELGRTWMLVEDVLKLGEGSVVELDKAAGDPVDVFVNDRLIARGEVLVLNDSFCVRISEVLSHDPHRVSA